MRIAYIVQPDQQLGTLLDGLLRDPYPSQLILVSAFVNRQTLQRLGNVILDMKAQGSEIRVVLGVDLHGTSKEALEELIMWDVDARVVKNRVPGHTFHPKIYFLRWDEKAELIMGSNNLTDGGLYKNYEGATRVTYDLPEDREELARALQELKRFLDPDNVVTYKLTPDLLARLIEQGYVLSEVDIRRTRVSESRRQNNREQSPLGVEDVPAPPPLPPSIVSREIQRSRHRRGRGDEVGGGQEVPTLPVDGTDMLEVSEFYMTLPTLQGDNIPGEGRIPLDAIRLAPDFWGWPIEYVRESRKTAGVERFYWNWYPQWKFWSVEAPADVTVQTVRMYMYESSSDFRFYIGLLVNAGADLGDVVRIRVSPEIGVDFECTLARQGTPEYEEWIRYCNQTVRNSTRRFGYR